ncbi:MAG: hypothetical protein P8I79_03085 [Amylibacter sp.]|nr:hypothetical protein [Amylibacter sp.]
MIITKSPALGLNGKSATITGTSSGIGLFYAMSLRRHSTAAFLAAKANKLVIESALKISGDWTAE